MYSGSKLLTQELFHLHKIIFILTSVQFCTDLTAQYLEWGGKDAFAAKFGIDWLCYEVIVITL